MRPLTLSLALLALAFPAAAGAADAKGAHSLTAVEAAFYHAGLPFQTDWRPNPYLVSKHGVGESSDARLMLPVALQPHLIGAAFGANVRTYVNWQAWVFDTTAAATAYYQIEKAGHYVPAHPLILLADNVVYWGNQGAHVLTAKRAMAYLAAH